MSDVLTELATLLRRDVARRRGGDVPCIVGVTGSVAVGKSTTAQLLEEALVSEHSGLRVQVVSTDGFLFPNRVLDARGLAARKGFPETFDRPALLRFLDDVKRCSADVRVPVYSHEQYDVLDEYEVVDRVDVLVVEGLHLVGLSPAIDTAVYVDAAEDDIERWFVERFVALSRGGHAFYRQFAAWPDDDLVVFAQQVWAGINAVNLHHHILPTRSRADVVVEKAPDHSMRRVWRPRGIIAG